MAVREVTDDNIKRRICIGWWITKAADTQSEYICFSTATMVTRTRLNFTYTYIYIYKSVCVCVLSFVV